MRRTRIVRVGVFRGKFLPLIGGGHTLVSEVFEAFLGLAGSSRHRFVAFCEPADAKRIAAARGAAGNVEICAMPDYAFLDGTVLAMRQYSPLLDRLVKWRSRLERAASQRGIEVIWFVGGGGRDPLDIPYIATVWDLQHRTHPWFPEVSSRGMWRARERTHVEFMRRAAHVVTGTTVGAQQLSFYYQLPPDRVSILPHPTPSLRAGASGTDPSQAVSRLKGERFFFYPAQFWPHKNHVNLLHALKILGDRDGVTAHLALSGSDHGNLRHVKSVVADLGLLDRVHFLGFVDANDLAWLYRNAIALVYPSFSGPENMPPLEAFSHGCPVAMSNYPGASEQAGDAALYFEPTEPDQLAQTLKKLFEQPALRDELIERGRARAGRWTAGDYVKGVFAILDEFEKKRRAWE